MNEAELHDAVIRLLHVSSFVRIDPNDEIARQVVNQYDDEIIRRRHWQFREQDPIDADNNLSKGQCSLSMLFIPVY